MRPSRLVLACLLAGTVLWWCWRGPEGLKALLRAWLAETTECEAEKKRNKKRTEEKGNRKQKDTDKRKESFALPPIVLPPPVPVPSMPVTVGESDLDDRSPSDIVDTDDGSTDEASTDSGDRAALASVWRGEVPMFTAREALTDD